MKDIIKTAIFLLLVSAIAAGALSLTYLVTAPRIEEQKKHDISNALTTSCMPGASNTKETSRKGMTYYTGFDDKGGIWGYAFRVSPKGYGGAIDMMVGVNKYGKVSGIKIVSMNETPGLGTQTNTPQFLGQFIGKTNKDKLKAKADIDAISGATISSQAVSNGVKKALTLFDII